MCACFEWPIFDFDAEPYTWRQPTHPLFTHRLLSQCNIQIFGYGTHTPFRRVTSKRTEKKRLHKAICGTYRMFQLFFFFFSAFICVSSVWHVHFVNDNGQNHANTPNTGVFAVSARTCHLVTGAKWNLCVCKCYGRDKSHARHRGMSNWNVNGIVQSCLILPMRWSVCLPLSSLFFVFFFASVFTIQICSILRLKAMPPESELCVSIAEWNAYTMEQFQIRKFLIPFKICWNWFGSLSLAPVFWILLRLSAAFQQKPFGIFELM